MYEKFTFESNGMIYSSDHDKNNEKNQDEVDYFEFITISLIIAAVVLSALSIYHLNKNTNFFKFKHKKKIAKSGQKAKKIISGFDNKDVLLLFEKEKIPESLSFLKNVDLTIITDDFLNTVDKLGFDDDEKAEFLKDMLYFSEEERKNIVDHLLEKLKSFKSSKYSR